MKKTLVKKDNQKKVKRKANIKQVATSVVCVLLVLIMVLSTFSAMLV